MAGSSEEVEARGRRRYCTLDDGRSVDDESTRRKARKRDLRDAEHGEESEEVPPQRVDLDCEHVLLMMSAHHQAGLSQEKKSRQHQIWEKVRGGRSRLTIPITDAGNGLNDPDHVGGFSMLRRGRRSS